MTWMKEPQIEYTRFDPLDVEDHLHGPEISIDGLNVIAMVWDERTDQYRISVGYDGAFDVELELDTFITALNTGKRLLSQAGPAGSHVL